VHLASLFGQARRKGTATRKEKAQKIHARAHRLLEAIRPDDVFDGSPPVGRGFAACDMVPGSDEM
jgi:hypothetical protein